ncbi:MAG: rRNA maturation RNase YbeY [Myxococcota bacterium]
MAVDLALEGAAAAEKALGKVLAKDARALLKAAGMARRELSLVLTDDLHIRELNREWRGEDKATDVLSFPMDEASDDDVPVIVGGGPGAATSPLGDIVISLETTAVEAAAVGFERDVMAAFLLVHGFCHLLGHDHAEPGEAAAMRAEEDRLFALVRPGVARPPTPY